jgi:TolA-binding protein
MDAAPLPDLDGLDREALKALVLAHQAELTALGAELESQRHILAEQRQELRSSSEQIEHLKLVIEKLRRRVFGVKSEKVVIQLEQLELHLEELESSQAEMEAAVDRVTPVAEPKTRSWRSRYPNICHARLSVTPFTATRVLTTAASCASSAKMSPSNLSTFRIASR